MNTAQDMNGSALFLDRDRRDQCGSRLRPSPRPVRVRLWNFPIGAVHGIGEYRREHPWRKPNPGMILQAIFDFKLDPARCAIVGDKMSDIEAGAAAGLGLRILVASRRCQNGGQRSPTP